MKLGVNIAPGMEATITLSQTELIHLSAPYSNCTNQKMFDPSTKYSTYTADFCFEVCLQKQYLAKCGCIYSTLQFTLDQLIEANLTICGNLSITEANSSISWHGLHQLVCAELLSVHRDACNTKCFTPCQEFKYATSVTANPWPHISAQASFYITYLFNNSRFGNKFDEYLDLGNVSLTNTSAAQVLLKKLDKEGLIRDNFLQLNVRFETSIYTEQRDVAAVPLDALGAQIGGVLSLWLGVTIILIFELCEFVFHLLVICYRAKKENKISDAYETDEKKL